VFEIAGYFGAEKASGDGVVGIAAEAVAVILIVDVDEQRTGVGTIEGADGVDCAGHFHTIISDRPRGQVCNGPMCGPTGYRCLRTDHVVGLATARCAGQLDIVVCEGRWLRMKFRHSSPTTMMSKKNVVAAGGRILRPPFPAARELSGIYRTR
jgi:hypothetical protein